MSTFTGADRMRPSPTAPKALTEFLDSIKNGLHSSNLLLQNPSLNSLLKVTEAEIALAATAIIQADKLTPPDTVIGPVQVSIIANVAGVAVIRNLSAIDEDTLFRTMQVVDRHSLIPRDLPSLFHVALWKAHLRENTPTRYREADQDGSHLASDIESYRVALDLVEQMIRLQLEVPTSSRLIAPLGNLARLMRGHDAYGVEYKGICQRLERVIDSQDRAPTPVLVEGLFEMGVYYAREKAPERAVELLERARQAAETVEAHYSLIRILHLLGDTYGWIQDLSSAASCYFKAAETIRMLDASGNNEALSLDASELAAKFRSVSEQMNGAITRL